MHRDTANMIGQRPLGVAAFSVGILTGTLIAAVLLVLDAIGRGDPDSGLLAIVVFMCLPLCWFINSLIGWLPFYALKKLAPKGRLARLAFVLFILTPLTSIMWLVVSQVLDALLNSSPYLHSERPSIADRLELVVTQHWRVVLFIDFWSALACWGVDQRSCLFAEDRSLRLKARLTLAAVVMVLVLPVILFVTCNQYIVEYRAQQIAGVRPYCILVPTDDARIYVAATHHSQLSLFHMQASYKWVTGSIGGYYVTNHAVLVLDKPLDYRNWSYRSENFLTNRLINFDRLKHIGYAYKSFESCTPERNFIENLQ